MPEDKDIIDKFNKTHRDLIETIDKHLAYIDEIINELSVLNDKLDALGKNE